MFKFTINLQRINSKSSEAMHRCSGKARERLVTIETESSQEVIHMPGPFPLPPPHLTPLSWKSVLTVFSESGLSTLITAQLMSSTRAGGRPLQQRKRHLTETHPPCSSLGSLTFPRQGKQTSFLKELCFQCGKEKKRSGGELEKVSSCSPLAGSPRPGKFLFFQKR